MSLRAARLDQASRQQKQLLGIVVVVVVTMAATLSTIRVARPLMPVDDNPSPYGYTVSLLLWIGPLVAMLWGYHRRQDDRRELAPVWICLALLALIGFVLDVLFASTFFTFVNREAVVGLWVPVVGGSVPVEEFVFYASGFAAILLTYLWMKSLWHDEPQRDFSHPRYQRTVGMSIRTLAVGVALAVLGIVVKKLGPMPEGLPGYYLFLLALAILPTMIFLPIVNDMIHWPALSTTFGLITLIALVWEATLAVPFQWWGYQPEAMLGIFIRGWSNLPLEAVILWLAVCFATAVIYELIRILCLRPRRGDSAAGST